MEENSVKLAACPFCGSSASPKRVLGQHHEITCDNENCGAHIWDTIPEKWNRRTPGPATRAMLEWVRRQIEFVDNSDCPTVGHDPCFEAFLAEWAEPATPPAPEQSEPSSPWTCCICHAPVRIGDDLRPYHVAGPGNHEAELSSEDLKILADGLRMSD